MVRSAAARHKVIADDILGDQWWGIEPVRVKPHRRSTQDRFDRSARQWVAHRSQGEASTRFVALDWLPINYCYLPPGAFLSRALFSMFLLISTPFHISAFILRTRNEFLNQSKCQLVGSYVLLETDFLCTERLSLLKRQVRFNQNSRILYWRVKFDALSWCFRFWRDATRVHVF